MGLLKKIKHGAHHVTHNPPSIPTPHPSIPTPHPSIPVPHISIPIPHIPKPVHMPSIPVPAPIKHIARESEHKAVKIIDTTSDLGSSNKKHNSSDKDAIDPTPDEDNWLIYAAVGIGFAGLMLIL
jgi:hypothetical protein